MVSLVDTPAAQIDVVELSASYSFRSLGRGPEEEARVLGTDGVLRSMDEENGSIASRECHVVDLQTDEVVDSTELPHKPNEMSGVTG